MRALGRRTPTDWSHYDKYPLTAGTVPTSPVPVAIGINWYTNFDNPVKDSKGRYWIGKGNLGSIRGGHCVCIEPGDQLDSAGKVTRRLQDSSSWWDFYNQGAEGACVGFGCSRMMTLLNRKRYDARWLWDWAKKTDEWSDTNPGDDNGTSVHAACTILASKGHVAWASKYANNTWQQRDNETPVSSEGLSVYRWANTTDQVMQVIKSPASEAMGAVRILNSWGKDYPERVWMPLATLQRLISEDGEVVLATDR